MRKLFVTVVAMTILTATLNAGSRHQERGRMYATRSTKV